MRPGHFWACELGNAADLLPELRQDASRQDSSPILAGPFASRQYWPPSEGEPGWKEAFRGIPRQRYDTGECALLLRCYYHRTADDPEGLTFVRWMGQARGVILVVNSSELRAVQGRQVCDFRLTPPKPQPPLRQQQARAKKQQPSGGFDPKQRLRLDRDLDVSTRIVCEGT